MSKTKNLADLKDRQIHRKNSKGFELERLHTMQRPDISLRTLKTSLHIRGSEASIPSADRNVICDNKFTWLRFQASDIS